MRNLGLAEKHLEAALALRPDDRLARFGLASIHLAHGDREVAISELERLVGGFPDYINARFHLGLGYCQMRRYPEAVEPFRVVLSLDDTRHRAHWALGTALAMLDQFGAAEECFERAASLCPSDGEVWEALGLTRAVRGNKRGALCAFGAGLFHCPLRWRLYPLSLSCSLGRLTTDPFPR